MQKQYGMFRKKAEASICNLRLIRDRDIEIRVKKVEFADFSQFFFIFALERSRKFIRLSRHQFLIDKYAKLKRKTGLLPYILAAN